MMHRLLGTVIGLPIESLRRDVRMQLEPRDDETNGEKEQHELLAKIARMKVEKKVLDADILALEDESM